MRLGAPILTDFRGPGDWTEELKRHGYRAAYWPLEKGAPAGLEDAFASAAYDADIVIAEVHAWSNLISPDEEERAAAVRLNQEQLALADRLGARCCLNLAGSRSASSLTDPHPENFDQETFALLARQVRAVIDAVSPTRTYYTLEMMPCVFPDSADNYLELIRAVDRERFAVHLDVVNVICSPRRYLGSSDLVRDCIAKLGPLIKSCHIKDTLMTASLMAHIDEVPPGLGTLDYGVLLGELDGIGDADLPLMMEHMKATEEYMEAARYVRDAADSVGVQL